MTTTYTTTRKPRRPRGAAPIVTTRTRTSAVPLDVVDTSVWGPSMWRVLHVLSLLSPPTAWAGVPTALDGALPCPDCRTHFHAWVVAHPLVATGTGPRDWVAALHNAVNTRLGRPTWTMEEVLAAYGTLTRADAVAALGVVRGMIGSVGLAALDALVAATP